MSTLIQAIENKDEQYRKGFIDALCKVGKAQELIEAFHQETIELRKILYLVQQQKEQSDFSHNQQLSIMDQVVSDSGGLYVECRGCGEDYELPCDLSEFHPDMSYCGGSSRCCP
jgi:hypothetical protein